MGGYLLGSESGFRVWWRFDPIDNVRGRLRLHVYGGKDLSINNEARPRERSDRGRFVPLGKKASSYRGAYRLPSFN